jgi:hypothetical protein
VWDEARLGAIVFFLLLGGWVGAGPVEATAGRHVVPAAYVCLAVSRTSLLIRATR